MKSLNRSVKPGDFFYIPGINKEKKYGFVIARYIDFIKPNAGYLIEVFSKFYIDFLPSIKNADVSERLFRPVTCSLAFHNIPRWKILFSDSSYDKSQSDYENISFMYDDFDLWRGGEIIPIDREQSAAYEDSTCWRMDHLIFRVNAHLADFLGPNDGYDYCRLPKNERIDSLEAEAKVCDVAIKIDNLFKEFSLLNKSKNSSQIDGLTN